MAPAATSDDPALVAGCRAGEATSLEQFFVTHVHYVERVISRLTGPTPDLEDLVQTTFIQAFQSFGRYRGEASLKTWVTRIAVHTALHQLRSGVRRAVPLELVSDADEPSDPTDAPDQQAASRQLARRLHALLDRVAPKKRVAFLLYTVEEYSIRRGGGADRSQQGGDQVAHLVRAARADGDGAGAGGSAATDRILGGTVMAMSCGQVGRLSVASAGGHATEAERLELEAHFATCARCAAEHAIVLGATRVLRSAEPDALSSAARERVRRAALARRAHAPVASRRFGWPLAGGAVLAMAAAVAISDRRPQAGRDRRRRRRRDRRGGARGTRAGARRRRGASGNRPLGSGRRGEAGRCVHRAGACDGARLAPRTAGRRAARGLTDRRHRAPPGATLRGPHPALRGRGGRHAVLGRFRRCSHGARHRPGAVARRRS